MAKKNDLADLTTRAARAARRGTKQELFNLRFQNATGQLDNTPHQAGQAGHRPYPDRAAGP
jgi:ribosomal protein L29